jgi:hypothetical protein
VPKAHVHVSVAPHVPSEESPQTKGPSPPAAAQPDSRSPTGPSARRRPRPQESRAATPLAGRLSAGPKSTPPVGEAVAGLWAWRDLPRGHLLLRGLIAAQAQAQARVLVSAAGWHWAATGPTRAYWRTGRLQPGAGPSRVFPTRCAGFAMARPSWDPSRAGRGWRRAATASETAPRGVRTASRHRW